MPLHLLGKKSWNVYNKSNIERVRRDEAQARHEYLVAREKAASTQLEFLRQGRPLETTQEDREHPTVALGPVGRSITDGNSEHNEQHSVTDSRHGTEGRGNRHRKLRRRDGEDETDFEMRLANERKSSDPSRTSLFGPDGHIDLFGPVDHTAQGRRRQPATASSGVAHGSSQNDLHASQSRWDHGRHQGAWYMTETEPHSSSKPTALVNFDKQRRGEARLAADDPLALMKQGSRKAKEVARQRRGLEDSRREKDDERRRRRREHREERRRRHRDSSTDRKQR